MSVEMDDSSGRETSGHSYDQEQLVAATQPDMIVTTEQKGF